MIIRYQKVLFEGDEIPERFTRTFGAGEGWKDLPLYTGDKPKQNMSRRPGRCGKDAVQPSCGSGLAMAE